MSIANTFPFFEADQVLTNKHLNDMFNYLDQQERLTRCKLIGSGIACGLEILITNDSINVTKGCGLTSQGYIMLLCDHTGDNGYKYYMPFTKPAFPNDLEIISQCGDPDLTNIPFYAAANNGATAAPDDIQLLLTKNDFDALSDNSNAVLISQGGDLSKYNVVLFLDVNELKLKNCDTNDCNDKGSLMDFEIKALLVNKALLTSGNNNGDGNVAFSPIKLRRYNVPVNNLNSSDDVLNAFVNLLSADSILDTLAKDLNYCFITYQSLLTGINNYSFGSGADFKKTLDLIRLSFPIYLQYYYDFIYDLIKAVYEFRYNAYFITSECCGDEMKFPFHLTLGEASTNTTNAASAYRQYFIYSPLFDSQSQGSNELRSLLMRMILMHQGYLLMEKSLNEGLPQHIRITPSAYGRNSISERCIPYYYKTVHDNNDLIAEDLYYYWNYEKTKRGNSKSNLSYDPTPYNSADEIVNPLYYDIEWYDFFRIEGHIGKPVNTALSDLVSKKRNLNLPFDVIALSADYIGALLRGDDPQCIVQDLESDYRILIAEFICKLHDAFCMAAKQTFTPPIQILETGIFEVNAAANVKDTSKKAAPLKPTSVLEQVNIAIDHPFISNLVNEFQATASYTKGDTLSRLCFPADGTIGSYYISGMKANNGSFVDPDPNNPLNSALFQFVDSVESMLQVLMIENLPVLNTTAFKSLYSVFEKATNALKDILRGLITDFQNSGKSRVLHIDYSLDLLVNTAQSILQTCIVEKLEALKNEYLRRDAQRKLANNFNYYSKKHSGLEHKAGVPRAGTFILVYHEERRNRFVDVNSLFINKELSDVLLTNFRELLQPDVDLDTREAKAKLLAVATLYKDPSLYLRFKDVMQEYLDNCSGLPPDIKNQIGTIINRPPDNPTYQLADGTVIADFYVPYMCCSDCPPIAYILPTAPTQDPISVTKSDPVCDQEGKNFKVILTVTGGTPPYSYTVNNATTSNEVTLPSGSPDTPVLIKDAAGQMFTATINGHTCCDLPCGGLAENCKYVLWMPIPRAGSNDIITHNSIQVKLILTDENSNDVPIVGASDAFVSELLGTSIAAPQLQDTFTQLMAKLDAFIPANFKGNNKPMFSYDVDNKLIMIERFTCQNIAVLLDITAVVMVNKTRYNIHAIYDNNGVTIETASPKLRIRVPKVGCITMNKCTNTPPVELCNKNLIIDTVTARPLGNRTFTFSTSPGVPPFDTFFWYFHDGKPLYSTDATPKVLMNLTAPATFIRVLGIDSKTGCFAIFEDTVKIG